jgi:biopolymer transport protein ExbD
VIVRRIRRKKSENPYLNLISLMDMFTILVIFLLFQASNDGEVLPIARGVILPQSTASEAPRRALTITITPTEILLSDARIADVQTVLNEPEPWVPALKERLSAQTEKRVTILGDRNIPFTLLKKVMVTCTESGIDRISLAVLSKESA